MFCHYKITFNVEMFSNLNINSHLSIFHITRKTGHSEEKGSI